MRFFFFENSMFKMLFWFSQQLSLHSLMPNDIGEVQTIFKADQQWLCSFKPIKMTHEPCPFSHGETRM